MAAPSALHRDTHTSLLLNIAQIVEGDEQCTYCANAATLVTANGADTDYEPVCTLCGLQWLSVTTEMVKGLLPA